MSTKERPIIFSGPMVRSILDGRKTQTRRIIKPQPAWVYGDTVPVKTADADPKGAIRCPYGKPGDRLWVRETFRIFCNVHDGGFPEDHFPCECRKVDAYRATIEHPEMVDWRSPIHMPRWASRILLEVVSVRVERLQDISEADALAEGGWEYKACPRHKDPRGSYRDLWESIHGNAQSWQANPWVWVVEFKRVEGGAA